MKTMSRLDGFLVSAWLLLLLVGVLYGCVRHGEEDETAQPPTDAEFKVSDWDDYEDIEMKIHD